MNWRTIYKESVSSLRFNRRRTIVTLLSLAWGVASFVLLMSYGTGFDTALRTAFMAVGQDLVIMFEGQTSQQNGGLRGGRRVRMREEDAEELREAVPLIAAISPEAYVNRAGVVRGSRENQYALRGVRPEYQRIRNMTLNAGRWLAPEDNLHRYRVAVLGATVAKELFSAIPPVGETITINGLRFTVVGVLETKMQIANYSRADNQCIFLPYDTMSAFTDIRYPTFIVWMPVSGALRDDAIRQVRATLAGIHNFAPTDDKAIQILAFSKFMHIIDGMTLALKLLLGLVGALTLGIGGVGLANIMLAAVMDRTREIGMLKALGVGRRAILAQFLSEALLIVALGGAIGIALGVAATLALGSMPLLGALFKEATDKGDLQLQVSAGAVATSTAVLLLVGLIAGMIPAIRASRLDPIEALRYE